MSANPLFRDLAPTKRGKRFLLSASEGELDLLRKIATLKGISVAVLLRRVVRIALIEKPDLFNLFD
jgi:hypothetical protein